MTPGPGTISQSPLTVAAFDVRAVREVRHGEGRVSRTPGDSLLEVDLDAVESLIADEPAIASLRAHVVRPGDPVRIANVLDAVVPSVKVDDPSSTFPGVLGPPDAECGTGRTNRLGGVAVLSTLDMGAMIDPDDPIPASYVDMDGPAASLTPWASTINLVLEMAPSPGASLADVDLASRRVSLRAARELAAGTLVREVGPDSEQRYSAPPSERDLPVVVPILQFTGEGPGLATYLRGTAVDELLPCAIDPRVLLDGGMTCGEYDSPSARNPTALLQTSRLIERLLGEHDRTLRLPGAVLTLGYLDDAGEKRRMAEAAADIAVGELGADAVICTAYSLGNSHTDTMLTIAASESRGARSVGIVAEEAGLVDHVAEADALISTGNVLQRVEGWTPALVLGERDHEPPPQIPVLNYLGATTQIGDLRLRGVSA